MENLCVDSMIILRWMVVYQDTKVSDHSEQGPVAESYEQANEYIDVADHRNV